MLVMPKGTQLVSKMVHKKGNTMEQKLVSSMASNLAVW